MKRLWWKIKRWVLQPYNYKKIKKVGCLPDKVPYHYFILVGEKWILFRCPCGCGDTIKLPLMKNKTFYWEMQIDNSKLSLNPSIDIKYPGCGAHFWIINNQVVWVD
jgi:hypothetical protein